MASDFVPRDCYGEGCDWTNGYRRFQDGSFEAAKYDHVRECPHIRCHHCNDVPFDIVIVPASKENGWRGTLGPCPACKP